MPRLTELELAQRRIKQLEKKLKSLSDDVLVFLHLHDEQMKKASDFERGRRIARMSNWLDQRNDLIRYSTLGVNFRRDDKDKLAARMIAKMKADTLDRNPALAEEVKAKNGA